jgi:DNA-binding MurR/RpiR family transcriptional regulator
MFDLNSLPKNKLTNSDKLILEYLLCHYDTTSLETATDIADKIGVSYATISRFWEKIGFSNMKEFKKALIQSKDTTPVSKIKNTLSKLDDKDSTISKIFTRNISTIDKTLNFLSSEEVDNAASLMISAAKIFVFAPDASLSIALLLRYRLRRFGIEFILIEGGSSIYEYLLNISNNDVVLIFSYSRIISEVSILIEHQKTAGYKTIFFTDMLTNTLSYHPDATIYCYRGEPTEYHSMVAALSTIDCLILKIAINKKNSLDFIDHLNQIRSQYSEYIKR